MAFVGPSFLKKLTRYGNWTGPGWSAGRASPPGDPITEADVLVPGVDAFDENVSKPHDIAYDRVQRRFLAEFVDPTIDKYTALANYFEALARADKAFIRAAKKPENLADEPGRQIQINAIDLFRVKSAWEETRASECRRGWGPNYADRIQKWSRPKILADLDWPKRTIPDDLPRITT
jgi:hypothetical protein